MRDLGWLALLSATSALAVTSSRGITEPSCVIRDYGVIQTSPSYVRRAESATTSGVVRSYFDMKVVRTTREIEAARGARFGVAHDFFNIPPLDNLEIVVTHPPMNRPDGQVRTGFKLPRSPNQTHSAYGLDHDYEVVRGEWKFEYFYKGRSLCSQSFVTR